LKGFIRCHTCNKNLTAGWSKGRNAKRLAYYWCWNRECKNRVTVPRETAEFKYFELLAMHKRTASLLARLPSLAAHAWAVRKQTIADDARVLSRRHAEQTTLRRKLIESKLVGEIDSDDYKIMRRAWMPKF